MAKPKDNPPNQGNGQVMLGTLLAALLPLIGGIVYVSLRGSYVKVYGRFGISPEDVGVNPYVVLTGAYRVFLLGNWRPISDLASLLIRLAIYILPLALMWFVWRLGQSKTAPAFLKDRLNGQPVSRVVWVYLITVLLAMALVFTATIHIDVNRALSRITDGEPVRPGDFSFLGVQAYPAAVHAMEGHQLPATFPRNQMLLYLGHANNHIILYNPCTHRTWRISEGTGLVIMGQDRARIRCCGVSSGHHGGRVSSDSASRLLAMR